MDAPARNIFSVSRVNSLIRDILQNELHLQNIWMEGEITNLVHHTSGHIYFSLKDEQSTISCTFFKYANQKVREIKLANGMRIQARGGISVFAPRGSYQFNVQQVLPAGEGLLRLQIEQLKKKLHAEGLFDLSRKRPLPPFPFTLGVASAPTGAAIQDIIRVARSRFPGINILLAPCVVQGPGAVESIVYAIQLLNRPEFNVDVIIAGRGGGSFENLLPFNDERVARAFAGSRVPIVSAVGHEIDHPISDLAADDFAPTPSAAVLKVLPLMSEITERIEECALRLRLSLVHSHTRGRRRLLQILNSKIHKKPAAMLEIWQMRMDQMHRSFNLGMQSRLHSNNRRLEKFDHFGMHFKAGLKRHEERFKLLEERLTNFSPLATLRRGYSLVRDKDKKVIRSAAQVERGDEIEIMLSQGRLKAKVTEALKE